MNLKNNDYIYFKEVKSTNISIRELRKSDDNAVFRLFSNPNVTEFLSFNPFQDFEQAKSLITRAIEQYENKDLFYLGITDNASDKVIGYIGLSRYDLTEYSAQIVYALSEDYWGRGLMVEAVKLFNDYLFNVLNKTIIIATHIKENVNSPKVMIRAGMARDKDHDMVLKIKGKEEYLEAYTIKKE